MKFGHEVSFEQARSQIGKGGDKLVPVFLSREEQNDHGRELEEWRSQRFKNRYLPLIRPFSAVPNLLQRVREAGLRTAVASSAKRDELEQFLEIAGVARLIDKATSSEDVHESKAAPDVFEAVLKSFQGCRRYRGLPIRCLGGREGDHAHHRCALRRFHREFAPTSRMRRGVSRTGCHVLLFRQVIPSHVGRHLGKAKHNGTTLHHARLLAREGGHDANFFNSGLLP